MMTTHSVRRSCVYFAPIRDVDESSPHHLHFIKGDGCWSHIGMSYQVQEFSLAEACLKPGTVMHELIHSIGFVHEQSRTDRDDYVTVHWDNIKEGKESNFAKYGHDLITDLYTR